MRELSNRVETKEIDGKNFKRKMSISEIKKDPTEDNVKALKKAHTKDGNLQLKEASVDSMRRSLKKESDETGEAINKIMKKINDDPGTLQSTKKADNDKYNSLVAKQNELKEVEKWLDRYVKLEDDDQRLGIWNNLEQKAKQAKLSSKDKRILYALDDESNGGDNNQENAASKGGTSKKDETVTQMSTDTSNQEDSSAWLFKNIKGYGIKTEMKKNADIPPEDSSKKNEEEIQIIIDQGDRYMQEFAEEYKKHLENPTNPVASSSSKETMAKMTAIKAVADKIGKDFEGKDSNSTWELKKLELYLRARTDTQILERLDTIAQNTTHKDKWLGNKSQKLYLGALVLGAIGTNLYNYALARAWEKH